MIRFGRRPSAIFRSLLALLLVCAQVFAAAHALGHLGELSLATRGGAEASVSSSDEGGAPASLRHEQCLLCLAAADLASALPSSPPLLAVETLSPVVPDNSPVAAPQRRLPRPHNRGPPLSSV